MGKALVLKNGVSFSANAVTTIEFASIPCTGIAFAHNTYTVSGYDDVTVEYTVTPADTTDSVIWTSSNPDIVTVSNGVMTVNGIGTCTITATCGEFSASATVTVSITCTPNWDFRALNQSGNIVSYGAKSYSRLTAFGAGAQASTYDLPATVSDHTASPYAVKLPANTAKVRISRGSGKGTSFYNGSSHNFCWMQDVSSGESYPSSAKYLSLVTFSPQSNAVTEIAVPTGADCFTFVTRLTTTYTESDDANTVALTLGLTIEFVPAE
jgi:hypothetical protein